MQKRLTDKKLKELEFLANKVLEGHHARTGYDLAPIILELIAEVRASRPYLQLSEYKEYNEPEIDEEERDLLAFLSFKNRFFTRLRRQRVLNRMFSELYHGAGIFSFRNFELALAHLAWAHAVEYSKNENTQESSNIWKQRYFQIRNRRL